MRPHHEPAGIAIRRFQQFGAADLLVFLRSEFRDDEFALVVE